MSQHSPPAPERADAVPVTALKRAMRREMRGRRGRVISADRERWSELIADALWTIEALSGALAMGSYAPLPGEVDVAAVTAEALRRGKAVYLPRGAPEGPPCLARVSAESALVPGLWGLPQPPAEAASIEPDELDVLVLPGLAFDRSGARLGQGGGWYDRLLARSTRRPVCIGVAFELQLVDWLPTDSHDARLDWVVTEAQVIRVAS